MKKVAKKIDWVNKTAEIDYELKKTELAERRYILDQKQQLHDSKMVLLQRIDELSPSLGRYLEAKAMEIFERHGFGKTGDETKPPA